jgi:pimeloyl-ACP methyl ester carboxylesterase
MRLCRIIIPLLLTSQVTALSQKIATFPVRRVEPPFPDGPCGGSIISLPPEDTYGIDSKLNGNQLLLPPRQIDVWLPPDYSPQRQHPVLLSHDGQNAMSDASSWTGASWRMIGALTRLADRKLLRTPTPIVVLLPSAEGDFIPGLRRRHLEYAADGLFAEAHADFVVNTIKPLVENRFSTSTEWHAIGTSLGGQASMQLLLRYPNEFRGVACMSPYFEPGTIASVAVNSVMLKSKHLYVDIGGDMGDEKVPVFDILDHLTPQHWWNPGYFWLDSQLQPGVEAMTAALNIDGVPFMYHKTPGGRHNERAWANRIDLPLLHLYGKRP